MNEQVEAGEAFGDADRIAELFALDPIGLGGVVLRARAGPLRDRWLSHVRVLLPPGTPLRRVPLHVGIERLLGGLDLSATLQAGRIVAQRGVLAEADGGVVLLSMAERLTAGTAAHVAAVLDTRELVMERDGLAMRIPSSFGVVALDEGIADDEGTPSRLLERLAFHLSLDVDAGAVAKLDARQATPSEAEAVRAGRVRLDDVQVGEEIVEALCAAALVLGIESVRAPLFALRAARAAAALEGRPRVDARHAALAARLVLAPRATRLPADAPEEGEADTTDDLEASDRPDDPAASEDPAPDSPVEPLVDAPDDSAPPGPAEPVDDVVLEAALAAIPPRLLASLKSAAGAVSRAQSAGRAGTVQISKLRGRPNGVRRGEPRGGARLNVIETLRAAAPWQGLRRCEAEAARRATARLGSAEAVTPHAVQTHPEKTHIETAHIETAHIETAHVASARLQNARVETAEPWSPNDRIPNIRIRREDFHVTRFKQRSETTTLFVVDASGSAALHRLAETKGAVELLLADCYVRRDSVAVIAFRGRGAELLLSPTRSLVRAKRSLAGLPGGGGTPLADGIDAAAALADSIRRRGCTPVVVLLTDGRANIARDGAPGRVRATADALDSARRMRLQGVATLLMDTSAQPQESARQLAQAMGAIYLPLPHAGAPVLSQAVRDASGRARSAR